MVVKKLIWLSKPAKEAKLIISDGTLTCVAFSQPCDMSEGQKLNEPLHAFMVKDLMLSVENQPYACLIRAETFIQKCVAEVYDLENGLVKIGGIKVELDQSLPPGIKEGDFVEFVCNRLDVW